MQIASTFSSNASETVNPSVSRVVNLVKKFQWVAADLTIANTSFYFYKKLFDTQKRGLRRELRKSPIFWNYTQRAHIQTALAYLCRVYDTYRAGSKDRDAFHLLRLVEEIDESILSDAKKRQRQADLKFLQKIFPDPRVAKLRKWRNYLLSHSNEMVVLNGLKPFREENPLATEEIQQLIDQGFSIIKRWAYQYKVRFPIKKLPQESDDYLLMLEALRLGLRQQKKT
jgi:hypothetical protein